MKTFFLAITWIAVLTTGCFRQEVQVAEYHIPDMSSPSDEAYIRARIKGIYGVESISSDLESHTLTVSYQSSTIRTMNIEESISIIGFSVNNRPANPRAKRPKGL